MTPSDGLRLFDRALPPTRARFASVMESFRAGERLAVALPLDLEAVRHRGPFALEGVGSRLASAAPATLRRLWPRLQPAERALVAIGVGWATEGMARRRAPPVLHGSVGGDVADGRGFHRALFHAYALAHPRRFRAPSRQGDFDRGVGRGAYFALGARPELLRRALDHFPDERRADLWTGVGVALAFTGGLAPDDVAALAAAGGPALAGGVRRAATLRAALAPLDELPEHTRLALHVTAPRDAL